MILDSMSSLGGNTIIQAGGEVDDKGDEAPHPYKMLG